MLAVTGIVAPQPALAAAHTSGEVQQELTTALKNYLSTKDGRYAVTVTELDGDQRTTSLNGARRVEPASTMKLFYAWAALQAIDEGTLTLGTHLRSGVSVGRCLTVMIQVSDNLCAVDLRLKLGMKTLNRLFASEGYANTYIVLNSSGEYVTKRTSSDDLALLLTRLEQGTLLSEAGTREFKKRLLAQIWRQRISSGVEEGTVVGSKSGQLWVSTGMVEADTAIIYGPQSTYVLTAIGTHGASGNTIRGISTIVYRYLQGEFTDRASFPTQQFTTVAKVKLRKTPGGSVVTYLPQGTRVQVISSSHTWMRVKAGSRYGWVTIQELSVRSAYRWPLPVVTADVAATGALCSILGTSGNDTLAGSTGADVICGLEGNDLLDGGTAYDVLNGGDGTDMCAFDQDDAVIDDSLSCEQDAVRLGAPLTDLAEPLRPYSDTNPERCLTNNCGLRAQTYCIVNRDSRLVNDCVIWDGWGDGWWEAFPAGNWVIVDRSKLPAWATFLDDPGSYLLSPA